MIEWNGTWKGEGKKNSRILSKWSVKRNVINWAIHSEISISAVLFLLLQSDQFSRLLGTPQSTPTTKEKEEEKKAAIRNQSPIDGMREQKKWYPEILWTPLMDGVTQLKHNGNSITGCVIPLIIHVKFTGGVDGPEIQIALNVSPIAIIFLLSIFGIP